MRRAGAARAWVVLKFSLLTLLAVLALFLLAIRIVERTSKHVYDWTAVTERRAT
jgi:uncharacterized protein HemY